MLKANITVRQVIVLIIIIIAAVLFIVHEQSKYTTYGEVVPRWNETKITEIRINDYVVTEEDLENLDFFQPPSLRGLKDTTVSLSDMEIIKSIFDNHLDMVLKELQGGVDVGYAITLISNGEKFGDLTVAQEYMTFLAKDRDTFNSGAFSVESENTLFQELDKIYKQYYTGKNN